VVEIILTGVARFSRAEIDTEAIEQAAKRHFNPLVVRLRSSLQEAPANRLEGTNSLDRHALESLVFENLIRADDRFAGSAATIAQVASTLKQMVSDGVPAIEIAEEAFTRLSTKAMASRDGESAAGSSSTPNATVPTAERRPADDSTELPPALSTNQIEAGKVSSLMQQDFLPGTGPKNSRNSSMSD
jgi:hypothetical protein